LGEGEHVSRFKVIEADVDQLRQHYTRTIASAHVNPLAGSKTISVEDLHFTIGEFDIWAGNCQSGMEVCFSEAPDVYAMYLPLAGALEFELRGREYLSASGMRPRTLKLAPFPPQPQPYRHRIQPEGTDATTQRDD
jgi:hypothetical protein